MILNLLIFLLNITDPGYINSFYLKNTGQFGGIKGEDINIEPVWERGYTGKGIHITFFVRGCYYKNLDLIDRFNSKKSFNFHMNTTDVSFADPIDLLIGNSLIGQAVASKNGIGTIGTAFESTFSVLVPSFINFFTFKNQFQDLLYEFLTDDIRVDYVSCFIYFLKYYLYYKTFKYSIEVVEHLEDAIYRGRNRLGTIYIIPALSLQNKVNKFVFQSCFSNCGEVITVSMSNYRGGAEIYNIPSVDILINSPGNGPILRGLLFMSPIIGSVPGSLSKKLFENFEESFGASTVAGVVALLLEANNKLTYRDVQWILLLTAVKNDPNNNLWKTNAGGFDYNPLYGFGRIDANESLNLALKWIILPRIIKFSITKIVNYLIPYANQGILNITFNINPDNNLIYCEYAYLYFIMTATDLTMFSIHVTSPSGTIFQVFHPILMENEILDNDSFINEPYRLLMRCFFGEKIKGNWTISIIDNSYIRGSYLKNISLEFIGFKEFPNIPQIKKKIGKNPEFQTNVQNYSLLNLKLKSTKIECGNKIPIEIIWLGPKINSTNNFLTYFFQNKTNGQLIYLGVITLTPGYQKFFFPPCILPTTNDLNLIFYHDKYHQIIEIPINYINENDEKIIQPVPYEIFYSEITRITFLDIHLLIKNLNSFLPGISAGTLISFYNTDSNKRFLSYQNHIWWVNTISLRDRIKAKNSVIVITTLTNQKILNCSSQILPLHIITSGDTPPKPFPLILNDLCPVVKGIIKISNESNNNNNNNFNYINNNIIFLIYLLILFLIIIFLILIFKIIKNKNKFNNLEESYLFE